MERIVKEIIKLKQDAVLLKAQILLSNAGDDVNNQSKAISNISVMLSMIESQVTRNEYIKRICKKHKIKATVLTDEVNRLCREAEQPSESHVPDDVQWTFPKGVDPEKAFRQGFYAIENGESTGYYFSSGLKQWTKQSNFILKPMLHIISQNDTDDKRVLEMYNGKETHLVDIESAKMLSVDQFAQRMYRIPGNNIFQGKREHLFKLLEAIGDNFEAAYELKTLGWQEEGFFAYSNSVVKDGQITDMDDKGIAEVRGRKFYSPSASSMYRSVRSDDDEYTNDRFLFYKKPEITFEEWAKLMMKVYAESHSGMIGIAYVAVGLFQDVVRAIDKNCPHLSAYGEKGSGKSKFAESLSNMFFSELPPCNLFHSTDFAFASRLSRYSNCIVWFDEFNDNTIREERFEAIKAAYEGIARERGKGGSRNKTEILRVKSAIVLTGQYLSTKDDNAALTRCIAIPFKKRDDNHARTNEEIKYYEELKIMEAQGLSGILVELLTHRKSFEKQYPRMFPEVFADMRELLTNSGISYNERVLRNYSVLLTTATILSQFFKLPFTIEEFKTLVRNETARLSTLISESDSLADFWNTIVYLLETGEIYEGFHFKIEELLAVTADKKEITYNVPKRVLFLRTTTIHKLYMEAHRRQNGKSGVNISTIELYLSTAKGYIGRSHSGRFVDKDGKVTITTSVMFDYDLLNVPLHQEEATEQELILSEVSGVLHSTVQLQHVLNKPNLVFDFKVDESYELAGKRVENIKLYKCYCDNLDIEHRLNSMNRLKLTGQVQEKVWKDKSGSEHWRRTILVHDVQTDIQLTMPLNNNEETPF